MKEKYIYENGKVFVVDQKENKGADLNKLEYQDNIEEIFITENIIEELRKEYSETKEIIESTKKTINARSYSKAAIVIAGISSLFAITGYLASFNPTLLSVPFVPGFFSYIIFFVIIFKNKQNAKKQLNGFNLELNKTIDEISDYEKKLQQLKNDRSKKNETNMKNEVISISHKEQLEELKHILNLYYNIGYYEKAFSEKYEKDQIDTQLHESFSEKDKVLIKSYFKELENKKKTTI